MDEDLKALFAILDRYVTVLEMLGMTEPVVGKKPKLTMHGQNVVATGLILLAMHEPETALPLLKKVLPLAQEAKRRSLEGI